ncbi:MAG: class I SAM-dependent methyltransferase [Parcubacteria group bacterium]|nr:class I SAM-dependent methyltransferase [Parcubacteria group bacterium]
MKVRLRKHPRLFMFFYRIAGVTTGVSAKRAIQHLPRGSLIYNIGSGVKVIREDVVNVDCAPYPTVSVVADVYHLPFNDGAADAVVAENLLEHLEKPEMAVHEMRRVLKQGGLLYISVPFMLGFHSSPGDYCRWTVSGLRRLLSGFEEKDLGVAMGPTNALTYALREWLSIALSFNSQTLYQLWTVFFMIVLAPFNLLDVIFARYAPSRNFCYAFYFIGTKK